MMKVAERFKVGRTTAKTYLKERGVLRVHTGHSRTEAAARARRKSWEDDGMDELKYWYYTCNLSAVATGKAMHLSDCAVLERLAKWKLPVRTHSEASIRGWMTKKAQAMHG